MYLKAKILVFFPTSHFRIALALFDKERHAFHYLESYNCVMPQGVQISGMPKRPFEMLLLPKPSLIMASGAYSKSSCLSVFYLFLLNGLQEEFHVVTCLIYIYCGRTGKY